MSQLPLPQAFTLCNWDSVPETSAPGTTGSVHSKTQQFGGMRVRLVRYSAGYLADHWCQRGHFVFVLSGAMVTELEGKEEVKMLAGYSYAVADKASSHRSKTDTGATLLIVD